MIFFVKQLIFIILILWLISNACILYYLQKVTTDYKCKRSVILLVRELTLTGSIIAAFDAAKWLKASEICSLKIVHGDFVPSYTYYSRYKFELAHYTSLSSVELNNIDILIVNSVSAIELFDNLIELKLTSTESEHLLSKSIFWIHEQLGQLNWIDIYSKANFESIKHAETWFPSHIAVQSWKRYAEINESYVVPNCINDDFESRKHFKQNERTSIRRQLHISSDSIVFLTVGTNMKHKGVNELLQVFLNIQNFSKFKLHFIWVGYVKGIDIMTENSNNIHIVPSETDAFPYYAAADVYVSGTKGESFGLAILQAIQMKLTTIVPNLGLLPAFVNNNEELMYEPNNMEQLFFKLQTILINLNNYKMLMPNLRNYVTSKFSCAKRNQVLVERVLNINNLAD